MASQAGPSGGNGSQSEVARMITVLNDQIYTDPTSDISDNPDSKIMVQPLGAWKSLKLYNRACCRYKLPMLDRHHYSTRSVRQGHLSAAEPEKDEVHSLSGTKSVKKKTSVAKKNNGPHEDPSDSAEYVDVYIGVDCDTMAPVIIRGKQQRLMRAPDTGDNFNTIHAHIVGCNTVPSIINPHYSLLKKTRLSFAKAVSLGPYAIDQFPDAIQQEINEEAVLEYRKDIDYKLHLGVPCEPIQNTSLHPLSFAALERTSPNNFQMMDFFWPKMKNIEYPKTLGQAVLEALEALPHDLVLDNVALALALIWCRLMDEVDFYPELLIKVGSNARKRSKIKPVSLIVFLVYGSHFLRLHSWFSLAVYGHPFRAISSLYENDVAFHKDLQLDPKLVDELAIRTEFRIMDLQKDD